MNRDRLTDTPIDTEAGRGVGTKFNPDGTAKGFAGNTIISLLSDDCAEFTLVKDVVEEIRAAAEPNFSFLPPASWHMTVFELLCDQVRDRGNWSRFIPTDQPLETTDLFFDDAFRLVERPEGFDMRHRCITSLGGVLAICLTPTPVPPPVRSRRIETG